MTNSENIKNEQPLDYIKPLPVQEDIIEADEYPGIVTRIQALFVDLIVMLLIFTLAAYIIDFAGGAPGWLRGSVLFTMVFLYDPLTLSLYGGTLGHYLMGIRVKREDDLSKNIMLPLAFLRLFFKSLLGWISFLTVTGNKRRRAIHDLISGSVVIKKQEEQ